MAIYVDQLMRCASTYDIPQCFRGKSSCHMWADSLHELHEIAEKLGLRLEWFQDDKRLPHYDLTLKRRAKAVRLGALETMTKRLIAAMHKYRGIKS